MKHSYDERKFTELLLYVATRLQGDRSGGATKLNKILFFADFAHVRRGAPITGAEYQKLEHGPAARRLRPVRDRLIANGDAELVDEEFLGYRSNAWLRNATPRSQQSPTMNSPRSTRC